MSKRILVAPLLLIMGALLMFPYFSSAATIQVDSNADTEVDADGECTLREAIENANSDSDTTGGDCTAGSGVDTITFSAAMTITPTSGYNLTSPIILNAITGGLGTCTTKTLGVVISPLSSDSTFFLGAGSDGSSIHGFVLPERGISADDSSDHTISCNIIGLDQTGMNAEGLGSFGINLMNTSGVVIGGTSAGDGNVISGNDSAGIQITDSEDISVFGNIIGLAKDGDTVIGTQESGININHGTNIVIGGPTVGHRNVISGNQKTTTAEGIVIGDSSTPSSGIVIQGNYLGTDITGMFARKNTQQDIEICGPASCGGGFPNVSDVTIGGSNAGEGNIIGSSGSVGVSVDGASGLTLLGNNIGVAVDGSTYLSDSTTIIGLSIQGTTNGTIGGSGANESNLFANTGSGNIFISQSSDFIILGNFFGVERDGVTSIIDPGTMLPVRSERGIGVGDGSSNTTIGGSGAGEENVFGSHEVSLGIIETTNAIIAGNYIGVGTDGTTALASSNDIGIFFGYSTGVIGGDTSADGNFISFNGIGGAVAGIATVTIKNNTVSHQEDLGFIVFDVEGVEIPGAVFSQNSMYDNGSLSIDLGTDSDANFSADENIGVTINDLGDSDSGANGYINHPVILKTEQSGSDTVVTYFLDVPVSINPYHVEFFTNPSGLSSTRFGEGEVYEDFANVTVSSSGQQIFAKTLAGVLPDDVITANVTDCMDPSCTAFGGTSEFSNSFPRGVDFGTAPGGDTDINPRGAYHIISSVYFMGACTNADLGDSSNDTIQFIQSGAHVGSGPCTANDRNGVVFDQSSYTSTDSIQTTVTVSNDGYLSVWMDLNQDGDFSDSDEWLFVEEEAFAGANNITLPVTPSTPGSYWVRFRYTSSDAGTLLSIGEALDGEVEDYMVTITAPASPSGGGGGVSGGGATYSCKDSNALNYSSFGVHNQALCKYDSYAYTVTISNPESLSTPNSPSTCPVFIGYYRKGDKNAEIKKIQAFLNKEVGTKLPLNGVYGPATDAAVRKFQAKYTTEILSPWQPPFTAKPTGRWYKTTRMKANQLLGCQEIPVVLEDNGTVWQLLVKNVVEKVL